MRGFCVVPVIVLLVLATSASAALIQKDSGDFNLLTFEGDTTTPAGWTKSGGGSASSDGDLLTYQTTGSQSIYWDLDNWSSMSVPDGYTFELRTQILNEVTPGGSPLIMLVNSGSERFQYGIGSDYATRREGPAGGPYPHYTIDTTPNNLALGDYRVAVTSADKGHYWKNGWLLAADTNGLDLSEHYFQFGDLTAGQNGTVAVDYARVDTTGAYAPPAPTGYAILVANRSTGPTSVLDLDGNGIASFATYLAGYTGMGVQQVSPGGEIVVTHHDGRPAAVSRYDGNGAFMGVYGGLPSSSVAQGVTIDDAGYVYVTYVSPGGVGRLNPATGLQDNYLSVGSGMPRSITFRPDDGFLYTCDYNLGVQRIATDFSSNDHVADLPGSGAGGNCMDLTFGPDGNLYVSTYGDNTVVRYNMTTTVWDTFIPDTGLLHLATGVMFHPFTGNLLVGSYNDDQILEFDGTTGDYIGVFASVPNPWYFSLTPVPEPGTCSLMVLGGLGLLWIGRRRRK